ncbi:MAG: tetratricopeptide repeat protein [Bacteroidota bacterium]
MLKHLFFLLLFLPFSLFAEQWSVDSLQNRLSQTEGPEKIRTLRVLSEALENEGYEVAIEAAEAAVKLGRELNDVLELGLSLTNRGIIQDMFGRYGDAMDSFVEAKTLLEQKGSMSAQANNLYYLGMAYFHLGKNERALSLCEEALGMFRSVQDSAGLAENLNGIGLIYQTQEEYGKSSEVFFQALDYAATSKQSHILGNIGINFLKLNEFEQALSYFRECYQLEKAQQKKVDLAYTLNYLGGVHYQMLEFDSAVYYFRTAYENNLALNQLEQIQLSLGNLVRALVQLGRKEEVFETIDLLEKQEDKEREFEQVRESVKFEAFQLLGQIDSSNVYLRKTIDSARVHGKWTTVYANSLLLARNYFSQQQWEKCIEAMKLHIAMKDSVFSKERTEIIQKLSIEYETEKKEAEIERLQVAEANARFRTRAWIIGCVLIAILGLAFIWFQSVNNRKNREIKLERLRTEIASDLHDEMGSILTGISMQAQMMQFGSSQGVAPYQQKIINNSQKAIATMRDVIWSIDSRYDQIGGLVDRMKEHAFEMLNPVDIEWDFKVDSWDLDQPMSPDVRQNLYLIFKEAINNIVKHAPENRVNISLLQQKDNWSLMIHNWSEKTENPSPVGPSIVQSLGQGLKNMEMRARKIGADFRLVRESGFQLILNGKTFPA